MEKLKLPIIILGTIIIVVLAVVFGFKVVETGAITREENINTASADIKVQEKRRVDLVYNLVDTVKEYDKHETETLLNVVKARSTTGDNIENATTMIKSVAESYPDLKSSANYKELMNELSITENLIAEHRSALNKEVQQYKKYTRSFPNSQILKIMGYTPIEVDYTNYNAPEDAPKNLFK